MALTGMIGQYRVERRLGAGAMGQVYLAIDTRMYDRKVALKILSEQLSENSHARKRFSKEVETASRLAPRHRLSDRSRALLRPLDADHPPGRSPSCRPSSCAVTRSTLEELARRQPAPRVEDPERSLSELTGPMLESG